MKTPVIIAHRGARNLLPENTLPAFLKALELGAGGIELDVLLSSDSVPVVTHNDDLKILTGFAGDVRSTPVKEIEALDAGINFTEQPTRTRIPRLENVLEILAKSDVLTIVEIKTQVGFISRAVPVIGKMISKFKFTGDVVVSSSNARILSDMRILYPKLKRAIIIPYPSLSFFMPYAYDKIGPLSAVHPSVIALSHGLMKKAEKIGCEVHAWTVNKERDVSKCLELGVDGIITDDVAAAREHIESARRSYAG